MLSHLSCWAELLTVLPRLQIITVLLGLQIVWIVGLSPICKFSLMIGSYSTHVHLPTWTDMEKISEQNGAAWREPVVLPAIISCQSNRTVTWLSVFLSYQAASPTERSLQYPFFKFLQYWVDMKVVTLWHLYKMPLEVKITKLCTQDLNESDLIFKGTELWIILRKGQCLWKLVFFDLRA